MKWSLVAQTLTAFLVALPVATAVGIPGAHAQPPGVCNPLARTCADNSVVGAHPAGDTHITGSGIVQTIDCNNRTLLVNGGGNQITALGTCWAVTVQGNGNIIVADRQIAFGRRDWTKDTIDSSGTFAPRNRTS